MNTQEIIKTVNNYLDKVTHELCLWLTNLLPQVADSWWQECVLANLSDSQRMQANSKGYSTLTDFNLSVLLRIADKCWYNIRSVTDMPTSYRECIRALTRVRNNWAHLTDTKLDKDTILQDLDILLEFFEAVIGSRLYTSDILALKHEIEGSIIIDTPADGNIQTSRNAISACEIQNSSSDIHERDTVFLTGEPTTRGMVFSVSDLDGMKRYEVFVSGEIRTYYEGQISKVDLTPQYNWISLQTFQSNLTAYAINNPSSGNLYSLNAARIDFVPYQFRPALKIIKADEPKILIADSVGVGKTIEAGLIIKELEARNELTNILIICPKPLVAERKWELEMQRFDEDFMPVNGEMLNQLLSATEREGEWPAKFNKAIIPYSILDSTTYQGASKKRSSIKGLHHGLLGLDPEPHFDLVIIDEAHHIRNGSLEKEKAYAYKCVRYFCEHSDAVVMLTATPLQTSDNDLFTLLNLLRPDIIIDKDIFQMMSRPNEFIYKASHAVRTASEHWQVETRKILQNIISTHWGENVIARNPLYTDILQRLSQKEISREDRVKLISDIESLHSFNTMLNRTRRKDIQDFCIRRSYTIETNFTPEQATLHDNLLIFESKALSVLYNVSSVPFLMSTLRRQAASCIFGLAPFIWDIVNRKFARFSDIPDFDPDEFILDAQGSTTLLELAQKIIKLSEELPEEDPKLDSIISIIEEKQKRKNNKIILFSTFHHTLNYLYKKLIKRNYRIAIIDGNTKDDDRRALRSRFELPKDDSDALDMLLFTEVGSEGLDYQFCDTIINYDLPWNPMRIEQRIGRIDRRGQQSEVVNIYNTITAGTIDADIYNRCLVRIGVFEKNIGECEEVLGAIASQIEKIASNPTLTEEEKRRKLEQMSDNEIRRMQELSKLEDDEKVLFGFDLSNYTASQEIKEAENPWLSPENLKHLVERYLTTRLGEGTYITGTQEIKQLRLNKDNRIKLFDDYKKLSSIKSGVKKQWDLYLRGNELTHAITFHSEAASKNRKAFFITPTHPLVKQAAKYCLQNQPSYLHLEYHSDSLPEGTYPFSIYTWNYIGFNPAFKVIPVAENAKVSEELLNIIQDAFNLPMISGLNTSSWDNLERLHIDKWRNEKERFQLEVKNLANYKIESIKSNYRNRKRNLEQKISDAIDEKIARMYQSELKTATENFHAKLSEITTEQSHADIHINLIANGILEIRSEND